mgnify:CR=1 FL=1
MKEYNLWGNILYEDIINNIDFQSVIDYAYDWKSRSPGIEISNKGGWHSNYYDDNHDEVDKLITTISEKTNLPVKLFWININPPGSSNVIHLHSHDGVGYVGSGVVYLRAKPGMGDIVFLKSATTGGREGYKKLSSETGKIYIFPSTMLHGVGKNRTDEDRISVSFNF